MVKGKLFLKFLDHSGDQEREGKERRCPGGHDAVFALPVLSGEEYKESYEKMYEIQKFRARDEGGGVPAKILWA